MECNFDPVGSIESQDCVGVAVESGIRIHAVIPFLTNGFRFAWRKSEKYESLTTDTGYEVCRKLAPPRLPLRIQ